jgi:hypothetical protein
LFAITDGQASLPYPVLLACAIAISFSRSPLSIVNAPRKRDGSKEVNHRAREGDKCRERV